MPDNETCLGNWEWVSDPDACFEEPAPPPEPRATIDARCRPIDDSIGGQFGLHCYIVTFDSIHQKMEFQGGELLGRPQGVLAAWATPGCCTPPNRETDARFYHKTDQPTDVVDCLIDFTKTVSQFRLPYHFFNGPNSNTFVVEAIPFCGLPRPTLPPNAPGQDHGLRP